MGNIRCSIIILFFCSFFCFADSVGIVKTCKLKQQEKIQLISVKTIDGNTLYLKIRNILIGAFLDSWEGNYLTVGDIVLSKCVNNSLVFAINYGSPYLKVCLVTGWNENDNKPESFCFAE